MFWLFEAEIPPPPNPISFFLDVVVGLVLFSPPAIWNVDEQKNSGLQFPTSQSFTTFFFSYSP
jgi:hypothetical protein